jgi:pre-rRNA-processing protein TSR3
MSHRATILVHYKERRSKCTLEPLRDRSDLAFVDFEPEMRVPAEGHVVLEVGAPVITEEDAGKPLMLLDATWRLLPALRRSLEGEFVTRSLPSGLTTAYPRRSKLEPDPDAGLASVEALHTALALLGHRDDTLLEAYRWRDAFLANCRAAGIF